MNTLLNTLTVIAIPLLIWSAFIVFGTIINYLTLSKEDKANVLKIVPSRELIIFILSLGYLGFYFG